MCELCSFLLTYVVEAIEGCCFTVVVVVVVMVVVMGVGDEMLRDVLSVLRACVRA